MKNAPILFTTIKLEEGILKAPLEHLEKLKHDYYALNKTKLSISIDDLSNFINSQNNLKGVWRLNVFASYPLYFKLTKEKEPLTKSYILKKYPTFFYEPLAQYKKEDFSLRQKLLLQAQKEGAHDWVFTNEEGFLLETAIANLFWIKDNTLFTPCDSLPLYMGVTLQKVLKNAKKLGFKIKKVKENKIESLLKAFVFITNSMKEILPVEKIENQQLSVNLKIAKTLNF